MGLLQTFLQFFALGMSERARGLVMLACQVDLGRIQSGVDDGQVEVRGRIFGREFQGLS